MDMEKLDAAAQDILQKIVDLAIVVLRAIGGGWATVAAAALSIFGITALMWWLKYIKTKAAKEETERKRKEAEAGNPGDNAEAERDGKKAADEIEEIIDGSKG